MSQHWYLWLGFFLLILILLALDLGVLHRKNREIKWREACILSAVWISIALLFNAGIFYWQGKEAGLQFLTAYVVEKSLSIDNIFVFIMIFSSFKVKAEQQHKILFWGILGALVMRGIFIYLGIAMIQRFHWITMVFGGFLVLTAIRMLLPKVKDIEPEKNILFRLTRRLIPMAPPSVTTTLASEGKEVSSRFIIRKKGRIYGTPLLLVLILVETSDLIFALDSIPAVIAVSSDPFIVYTSNVFAILGLRSLYFVLASVMDMFRYLHYGLSAVLAFVGIKMVIADFYTIPIGTSLLVIFSCLLISILWGFLQDKRH